MNQTDAQILRNLQENSSRPLAELASDIGLSPSACHRRVKLLEERGYIVGYSARLDQHSLGYEIMVFVEITLDSQSEEALNAFETEVGRLGEILECHLTTGDADYILRIAARSVGDFDRIHRESLSRLPRVASMKTRFSLRSIKGWRGFPVSAD